METETDGVTDREREMELPVAVGQGILRLFLLEELRDGQQLFQHMLQTHRDGDNCIQLTSYTVGRTAPSILCAYDRCFVFFSYTPAVLLFRCSRCGVHLSEQHRSHAGLQGLGTDRS